MIERLIMRHLIYTEEYARKVLPYLKVEYFQRRSDKALFTAVGEFINRYNALPTTEAIAVDLSVMRGTGMSDEEFSEAIGFLKEAQPEATDAKYMIDRTEEFCKTQALHNAVIQAANIVMDKTGKLSRHAIPQMLTDALSVSFNTRIGHDYLEDAEERYKDYHEMVKRVPFDITLFTEITRGGFAARTLNIWLAGVHVGKTFIMGHCAAANLKDMKNVLYITMEMSERQLSERLDANILNLKVSEITELPQDEYMAKIRNVAAQTTGKLIIKEYPTASAGAHHFRTLLNELRIKKNFIPDIVYIDYLNICMSSRFKPGSEMNSYSYIKAISEEIRGLAVEQDVPIVSATQLNRQGFRSADPELDDTAESFGLPATADFMAVAYRSEEADELNQLNFKQLKNRYTSIDKNKKFVVGIDRDKFQLHDCSQSAQHGINTTPGEVVPFGYDRPVMDTTNWS